MKIFGDLGSGNCLKVKYAADHLGIPYAWVGVDATKGETRTPEFLKRFPFARIPAVELEDGRPLAESNAILRYLARCTSLLPEDAYAQAKVDELLFWEQYSHEPYVAVCRYHMVYLGRPKDAREAWRVERGEAALDVMERLLADRKWLVGETITIADIALLPYTRLAHEGGFDLCSRPNVLAWIKRCEDVLQLEPLQTPTLAG